MKIPVFRDKIDHEIGGRIALRIDRNLSSAPKRVEWLEPGRWQMN
jgi:hypothetical protein